MPSLYINVKKVLTSNFHYNLFVTSAELRVSEIVWLKENQKKFDEKKLIILTKDFNLIYDDDNLIRCEGRLKKAPLPYETKTPYLINTCHCLATLIVKHFHESLLHISVKETLTKHSQKYWICRGRSFVRKILRNCNLCRKYEGPPYQYPAPPSATKLRLNDTFVYFNTRIDNFGPLYVRSIFTSNTGSWTLHKVWVTLYTCASSRGNVLDLVPSLDSVSFRRSFRRFIN